MISIEEIDKNIDKFGSSSLKLNVHGDNVDYSILNSLRHVCINQIPIYAFHPSKINILKNTSVYDNSYMRVRLSQLPINNINHIVKFLSLKYYKDINFADANYTKHPDDTFDITYFIKMKNTGPEKKAYVSTNDIRITINNEIIDNKKIYSSEYPILLIDLRPDEEFECSMKAVLAVGELDSIFNASNTYYEEIAENKYHLTVKSFGQKSEYEILNLGCEIIIEKLKIIKENVNQNQYNLIVTENNSLILEMINEDYTCGGVINYFLQNFKEVIYSGVTKTDFLQKNILLKLKVEQTANILETLNKAIDNSIKLFENIKKKLKN